MLTRREFGFGCCGLPLLADAQGDDFREFAAMPWNAPAKVAKVYLGSTQSHWPKYGLDLDQERVGVESQMAELARKSAADVQFVGGELLRTVEEVKPWLAKYGDVDGVLIVPLSQPTTPLGALVDGLVSPAVVFSRPYASHSWASIAEMRKKRGKRIDVVASSSTGDLEPYMKMFRTAHHMKVSKVLVAVESPAARQAQVGAYQKHFGTGFEFIGGKELRSAFDRADAKAAERAAEEFRRNALRVVEPSQKEILSGLRMYLGLKSLLAERKANAVTIDCFGSLKANELPGYPCIAWSKFNDAGLYGVCEADLASTMTQMLLTSYSGMPGFVSDPVFDVSRNEVIHAHCVSATKMKGIGGASSPYILRNHLETNEGAVVQVLMPADETITVARFTEPGRLLASTAVVTGGGDSDRGCRSQIRTRVADAEKWLQSYTAGLHRVIFYGDHMRTLERMGTADGIRVGEGGVGRSLALLQSANFGTLEFDGPSQETPGVFLRKRPWPPTCSRVDTGAFRGGSETGRPRRSKG